jgi:SAM-dependent methyltransferase
MRIMDRVLQNWRARVARRWIPRGARVLDIGCHQGEFLRGLGNWIGPSLGLDPLAVPEETPRFRLLAELFREPLPLEDASFDVVVMLATLEHIHDKDPLARECFRLLRDGGRFIITVPSSSVDRIVDLLVRLRLADGMSLDEHHGFDPRETPNIMARHGFSLEHGSRFQCGLNHLFVFTKNTTPAAANASSSKEETAGLVSATHN